MARSLSEIADDRTTQRLGPRPSISPIGAGLVGGLTAAAAVTLFLILIPSNPDPNGIAFLIVVAIGALAPFLYYWRLHRKWGMAAAKEYLSLPDDAE